MTTDRNPLQPAITIMPYGIQSDPAKALAVACDVPLQPYDLAVLAKSLAAGQRCVVVWSSPQSAVAQALRLQSAPSEMVAQWRQSIDSLLKLFGRFRRKLLLVDARVITQGKAEDLANLARRLPMTHALTAPRGVADLPDLLAQAMVGQLIDLRSSLDELQASSVSIVEASRTCADLDPVAEELAKLTNNHAHLEGKLKNLTSRHQEEGDLHRSALADLSSSLLEKAKALDETEALLAEAYRSAEQSDQEANLLREQLRDVSAVSAFSLSSQADQIAAAAVMTSSLEREAAGLREQLHDFAARTASDNATHTEQISAAKLTSALLGEETGFLRDQLVSLSEAFAANIVDAAKSADQGAYTAELDLARAQLQSLSQLLAQEDAAPSSDAAPAPQDASAELAMLREQLLALDAELNTQAATAPSSSGLDYARIEAAFAALLASLAKETDLRKAAQQQSLSDALALQIMTQGTGHRTMRSPVPPRPRTADALPFQNEPK